MTWTRRITQLGFLVLTVWGVFVIGANAERWCPFGGVEAIYSYFFSETGDMPCSLAMSNFYILVALLIVTLMFRRAFCGYVCPIGTVSLWLSSGATKLKLRKRPIKVPRTIDRVLSFVKYPLIVVILYFTYRTGELILRGYDPCYALIGRHGEDITFWAYIISGAVVVGSLFIMMPFCRWLCPLAVVFNLFSWMGLTRIKRNTKTCINCTLCDQTCPMAIDVSKMESVTSARCISCMRCTQSCPDSAEGALTWGPPNWIGRRWPQCVVVVVLLACMTVAVAASYMFPLPPYVRQRGDLPAETASIELGISGVKCRGSATRLWTNRLNRQDFFSVAGPMRVEAWPGPGWSKVVVIYDPALADEEMIRVAITEPYFDEEAGMWRTYLFEIEEYDALGY